ncbi:MAG: hemerythrin domain-containing protein [Acidobacteria bacterium]|nr:hemerythrin domain-containing protein [Acidobacteriota bacterium]MBI3657660.1 hemerythrin domain-containing protein [Acidobacteriota bacterium]
MTGSVEVSSTGKEGEGGELSFLALIRIHEHLNQLFFSHQEALLMFNLRIACDRMLVFEKELRSHMKVEEELLLPIYQRAGRILGGPVEFFTGEHKRMLEFVGRFCEKLRELDRNPLDLKREIIALLDEEATFKHLVMHHDEREQSILYPTLDRVTTDAERHEILPRCFPANSSLRQMGYCG